MSDIYPTLVECSVVLTPLSKRVILSYLGKEKSSTEKENELNPTKSRHGSASIAINGMKNCFVLLSPLQEKHYLNCISNQNSIEESARSNEPKISSTKKSPPTVKKSKTFEKNILRHKPAGPVRQSVRLSRARIVSS